MLQNYASINCESQVGSKAHLVLKGICPLPIALCKLPSAICPLPIALCQMPSANCPLPFCPLPIALCHLPSANCPLPFSLCQLPSVKYPLPFALCRLPSVKCPLPITPFSGGHLEEGKWQRVNGRGHLAQRAFRRGLLEEGFWMRAIFREGSQIWRAFGKELLEKGFWKRANFWRAIGMHPFNFPPKPKEFIQDPVVCVFQYQKGGYSTDLQ